MSAESRYTDFLDTYVPKTGFDLHRPLRILDVGCGEGLYTQRLIDFFGRRSHYQGIDIDKERITEAKRRGYQGNIDFCVRDARTLDNAIDGQFDVIVVNDPSILSLKERWDDILKGTYRVAKAEGLFVGVAFSGAENSLLRRLVREAGFWVIYASHAESYNLEKNRDELIADALDSLTESSVFTKKVPFVVGRKYAPLPTEGS